MVGRTFNVDRSVSLGRGLGTRIFKSPPASLGQIPLRKQKATPGLRETFTNNAARPAHLMRAASEATRFLG
jgi:hypothetical protein